jgi:hypothetical protein
VRDRPELAVVLKADCVQDKTLSGVEGPPEPPPLPRDFIPANLEADPVRLRYLYRAKISSERADGVGIVPARIAGHRDGIGV